MTPHCDSVAERVAFGEPLGELDEHVTGCARCQRVVAMPGRLGATRHDIDPGLGFSARMTVGAQHRIAARRRRRLASGLAASVAAGALGVVVMTRSPSDPASQRPVATEPSPPAPLEETDLEKLVDVADTGRTMRMSANWSRIDERLAPYRELVKETSEEVSEGESE